MNSISYKSWGMIPHDDDPHTGVCLKTSPPMMTIIAVDRHASLVFELASAVRGIQVRAEATAMSAEPLEEEVFSVYSGAAADRLYPVSSLQWEKVNEGMYTVFSTSIPAAGPFLKLHYQQESTLVLNKVQFESEE